MARVFITGSADGLGHLAAKLLANQGHRVVLHARNSTRGQQAIDRLPLAETVITADLSDIEQTKNLAAAVNALGYFDAIIHNAGVYYQTSSHDEQRTMLNINTLAPYILTCLIERPKRVVYLSSSMHLQGDSGLVSLSTQVNNKGSYQTYSDSKLHALILSMAVARSWNEVYSNAVDPGWVPTKMGGANAPDNLEKGAETQAWLAVSNDEKAKASGRYLYHQREKHFLPAASDPLVQKKFLILCEQLCGVRFPY
jgi:NAD(P)-dependent dehydrogenase (short-subunit alcohol dehydrogenase family)